jgi:chitosanase
MTSPQSDAGGYDAYTYTGTWSFNGTDEKYSTSNGATATAQVTIGTGGGTISVWGNTDTGGGKASVQVDGGTAVTVDTYNSTSPPGVDQNWWTSPTLTAGAHTVKVTVLGQKRTESTGTAVSIEGVNTTNGTITWPSSTSPSSTDVSKFVSAGTWTKETTFSKWYSNSTGATATTKVTIATGGGTVTIRGTKADNYGIAGFAVDGGTEVTADLYAATRAENTAVWTSPTLTAGDHTIAVRVTGTKRTAATDKYIAVTGADTTNGTFSLPGSTPPADTTPPATPTGLTAVAATGSNGSLAVDVSWNTVSDAAHYKLTLNGVERSTNYAGGSAIRFIDLVAGQSYAFTVIAVDAAGNRSTPSGAVSYTAPAPAPTITATATGGNAQVTVNWTASNVPTPATAGVWVQKSDGSAGVWYRTLQGSHTFTGLTNGTQLTLEAFVVRDGVTGNLATTSVTATPTAPPAHTLDDLVMKEKILQFVGTAENSNKDWTIGYPYCEYGAGIGDTRGYTLGIVGWTTATYDANVLLKHYRDIAPGNILAKWIDELDTIDAMSTQSQRHSASASLLGSAFAADVATAGGTALFQQAQKEERDRMYWAPAIAAAKADGLSPLGALIYYDTIVNHGSYPGDSVGGQSFQGIVLTAKSQTQTPTQGGNEATYLNKVLDARWAVLQSWGDAQTNGRVPALRSLITAGKWQLQVPLSWSMYGTTFTISSNPTPR